MFQILPSILFVKASNAELSESARFRRLAHTDLSERLKKRKMKALIPQIIQIIYFGALSIVLLVHWWFQVVLWMAVSWFLL